MYKTQSRNQQRGRREKEEPPQRRKNKPATVANFANESRAPYFDRVRRIVEADEDVRQADLPNWIYEEFASFGGAERWVRRNMHWQKLLRDELLRKGRRGRRGRQLPEWLAQEMSDLGRRRWSNIYGREQLSLATPKNATKRVPKNPARSVQRRIVRPLGVDTPPVVKRIQCAYCGFGVHELRNDSGEVRVYEIDSFRPHACKGQSPAKSLRAVRAGFESNRKRH